MIVSSYVPSGFQQTAVTAYLSTRFSYLSANAWRQLILDGRVQCNGRVCTPVTRVSQGDIIACDVPDPEVPPVNFNYTIIYEDEQVLAVNKPANLRVHSQGKFVAANLIYHLRHRHQPLYPTVNLVNRLDADTSGIVLLAKDKGTAQILGEQFREGAVEKVYTAVVEGIPNPANGRVDLPIGKVKSAKAPRFAVMEGGKSAITDYETMQTANGRYALLNLKPRNGRTHQLRVHMAALGCPIVGDALYTMDDDAYLHWRTTGQSTRPMLLNRQALHCAELRFRHPATASSCCIQAPLALDIQQFIHAEF